MTELEKLERQASWDEHRRKMMAERGRLRHEAAQTGQEEPRWIVDPPLKAPAYWKRPEGAVSVQRITTAPPAGPIDEVIDGRNAIGQVVKGREPEPLLTVERQFAILEGRDREERLKGIARRLAEIARGKESR